MWKSARELALDPERWAVTTWCERGYTKQLPDLAVWLKRCGPPIAVIAESGGRRGNRQKMVLEGWADAILAGCYAAVLYDGANGSVAHWVNRLAKKVRLTAPGFAATVQLSAPEIAALSPAATADEVPAREPRSPVEAAPPRDRPSQGVSAAMPIPPAPKQIESPGPSTDLWSETAQAVAAREKLYREVLWTEPRPRRRWRR